MSLLTHILICIFGSGSWVAINGLWVELPLLVERLPEGWNLPSYITIIIQLANVGPLLITLLHRFRPGYVSEVPIIYVLLAVGTIACFLFAFLWEKTSMVAGVSHSIAFLILTFILSLVDCTSSVTFLPFMANLPAHYMNTLFVGEGLSGLLPAIVALIQGSGTKTCAQVTNSSIITEPANITKIPFIAGDVTMSPDLVTRTPQPENCYLSANFSPFVFFLLLSVMMASCLAAFYGLTRISKRWVCSEDHLANQVTLKSFKSQEPSDGKSDKDNCPSLDLPEENKTAVWSRSQLVFIYILVAFVNALTNGIFPSIHSFSCLPYGSRAYHLSSVLSVIIYPVVCFVSVFLPEISLSWLGMVTVVGTGFGAYNMATAVLSPCPPLKGSPWGEALIIISWVTYHGILSYVKVITGVYLRKVSHSALLWCGAVIQLGSAIGAILMFPLVNVLQIFKSSYGSSVQCPI
ncbi:solute carrier family 52, riboflavin transporter, member 3-like [Sarcophilus harrisii]|uniref:Riboflavin transporter n=1 Tax=Sarcophilus harrisii TaxID=9305 RepID=G3WIJ7_SARHA|nr:solute carrier family 52, riboflavin transporter, member 3-like [Sarcophilus harrisii]